MSPAAPTSGHADEGRRTSGATRLGPDIRVIPVEQLAVRPERAAELLSMSDDFFRKHVLPDIAVVYVGRLRLVPIKVLTAWLEDNAVRRVWTTHP
jgi:hypothetical protein